MRAELTGGEVSDCKGFDAIVDEDLPQAKVLIADKGHDSDHVRESVEERGGASVIPGRASRKELTEIDGFAYKLQNRIERCINRLKCSKRLATHPNSPAAPSGSAPLIHSDPKARKLDLSHTLTGFRPTHPVSLLGSQTLQDRWCAT